jgi:hypothetical protein
MDGIKVLFVTGFGPIVRDDASRRLYADTLGIAFEESEGYLHTEHLDGAKTFALWPLSPPGEGEGEGERRNVVSRRHGRRATPPGSFEDLRTGAATLPTAVERDDTTTLVTRRAPTPQPSFPASASTHRTTRP